MRRLLITAFATFPLAAAASDYQPEIQDGDYLCAVSEKAGIASIHLEDAPPPNAYAESNVNNRFKIAIGAIELDGKPALEIKEIAYDGPDRDRTDYDDSNSVLHGAYIGTGGDLRATNDLGFMRIGKFQDKIWFYQSGFEYPGGVDVQLTVRFGSCERAAE